MYDTFFGFSKRPFASAPQVEQYFPGTTIEDARGALVRCLQRGEGAAMIVGPSGIGKTLLCQVLAEQFRDTFRVALLSNGRLGSRRALFQSILYELGLAYRGMDEGEARLAVADYLTNHEDCPQGMVLLIDEAHTLPLRLLDELRMLTNLGRKGEPLVRLVLAGANALEERFTNPRLDSFSQRLVARCYLEPFNRAETQDYIQSGIQAVGGDSEQLFPEPACHSVHQATEGVGRLINQLCDHSLLLAYAAGQHEVDPACVEAAWADLQQLPVPSASNSNEQETHGDADVIEFGGLDDMPVEAKAPVSDEKSVDDELPVEDSMPEQFDPEEFTEKFTEKFTEEFTEKFTEEFVADEPVAEQPIPEAEQPIPETEQPIPEATVSDESAAEELISSRPLQILPEIESVTTDDLEPTEQLQHVEQLLGDVEEYFQPAGTIGPELVFEQSGYPFNEKFVVEEIIADRYSSIPEPPAPLRQRPSEQPDIGTTAPDTGDRDILVVEDDYDNTPPSGPIVPVGREQYRQLFAKLRGR